MGLHLPLTEVVTADFHCLRETPLQVPLSSEYKAPFERVLL